MTHQNEDMPSKWGHFGQLSTEKNRGSRCFVVVVVVAVAVAVAVVVVVVVVVLVGQLLQ